MPHTHLTLCALGSRCIQISLSQCVCTRVILIAFYNIVNNEVTTELFKGAGVNALRTVGASLVLSLYS